MIETSSTCVISQQDLLALQIMEAMLREQLRDAEKVGWTVSNLNLEVKFKVRALLSLWKIPASSMRGRFIFDWPTRPYWPTLLQSGSGWWMASLHGEVGTRHIWQEIADSYLSYVCTVSWQALLEDYCGVWCYSNLPKDHDHIRSTKNSCCDAQIQPNTDAFDTKGKVSRLANS